MKILKISQQIDFPFYERVPVNEVPINCDYNNAEEIINDSVSWEEMRIRLDACKIRWYEVKFADRTIVVIMEGEEISILDGKDSIILQDSVDWLWNLSSMDLHSMIELYDKFSEEFWEAVVNGSEVYHATGKDRYKEMKESGYLESRSETRGISNRDTGPVIFVSDNPLDIESEGVIILKIDLWAMKSDNYIPYIYPEEPYVESQLRDGVAHAIGVDNFDSTSELDGDGISSTTLTINGNIPMKYVNLWNENNENNENM